MNAGPRGATIRSRRHSRGFTFFELVLVLILLAVAASLVAPRTLPLASRRLDATVVQAHAAARRARSQAVTRGLVTRLHLDVLEGAFWLEVEEDPFDAPGVFERLGDEWGQGVRLLEGVRIDGLEDDEVVFRPDGTAEDALIVFAAEDGERLGLEIRGVTGLSRVLEDDELAYLERRRREAK